jgi:hypothetical protein
MTNKKRTVETVKNELSKIDDKIEIMLEKGINETDPKFDKLNTKQNDLEIELEFLTNIMGEN